MLSIKVEELESENSDLKRLIQKMKTQFNSEQVKPKCCEYCQHYIQHYVEIQGRFITTHCGHCTHGHSKKRKPDDTCKYFELGSYDTKGVKLTDVERT